MARLSFRWSYVIAPAVVFLLSLALLASFYHLLPAQLAVRFGMDGAPTTWLGRGAAILWMLLPQPLLVLLAAGIVRGGTWLYGRSGRATGGLKVERLVSFMGNIIALPQLILLFAMLDILGYNAFQIHILPMWLFLVVILGLATIALVVLAVFIFIRARRAMS